MIRARRQALDDDRGTGAVTSNFTLAVDGIATSRVSKIDAFSVRRDVSTTTSGGNTTLSIGELTVPNLVVTVTGSDIASWKNWRASFLPQTAAGASLAPVQKKNGSLRFLSPNMTTPLFTLQLSGLAPVRLTTPPFDTASSAMAGLGGALYAHYVLTLTPSIVDFSEMARIVVMVVVGGLGSLWGPIIAAPPIYALNIWLAAWGEWSTVFFAAIVIVLMRAYPAGLAGLGELAARRWRQRGPALRP